MEIAEYYFHKQFELRYFEMNEMGVASPTTMLALLEETAADHCYSINHSLYDLISNDVGWVLVSGALQMERYPSYKEKITIRTWLSSYSLIKGYRENIIFDEQKNVIGRAKGLWLFFDVDKRRPTPIYKDIKTKWSYCNELSLESDLRKKIQPLIIDNDVKMETFKVNRFDTDMNKHVNNIRYLQWVIESIPEAIVANYYLHDIDGRFIAEAKYGDDVISLTKENGSKTSFIHTIIVKDSGKVCATAKSTWHKII